MHMSEQVPRDSGRTADEVGAEDAPGSRPGDEGPSRHDGESGAEVDHRTTPEEVEEAFAEADLDSEMERLQAEFDELNDRHLRLAAEFTNYRRRVEGEMSGAWDRAQADLVRRLLEVLDDLQRVAALDPADEAVTVESIVEGIDLVERKFLKALRDAGAELVAPEHGSAFDPETMEAMMRVPVDDEERDDTVAQVFQNGYTFRDQLVRPARVSVHKAD
jgi:molecular chaperone GrpE